MAELTYERVLELFAENNRQTNDLISNNIAKISKELDKRVSQTNKQTNC